MVFWLILLSTYFFYSFGQLKSLKGIKNICFILFLSFFVFGGLNKAIFSFIFELSDWIILITLFSIVLFGLINQRKYLIYFPRIEIILIFFLFFCFFVPLLYHLSNGVTSGFFQYVFPIRIYLVYKVFFLLLSEVNLRSGKEDYLSWIIPIILIVGVISATISLIKLLPYQIPIISNALDVAWPLPALKWYRLWGTNGGTNAAGNLFALLVLFSIYFNSKIKKTSISALKTVLFIICLLLSGSFSSIGGIMIVSFITIILIKELRVFNFKQLIISLFIFIGAFSFSGTIKDNLLLRVQKQFRVYGEFRLMPYSLEDRLHWWYKQIEKTQSDNKLMFGYGPGGLAKYIGANSNIDTGAESYYLTLLQLYGLPSILYFIVLIVFLLYLIKITYPFYKHMEILFPVILFYPIAGIANETLHYGAMTEIFGFTISLLAVLNYNTKVLRI